MALTVSLEWDPVTSPELVGYRMYYSDTASPLATAPPLEVGIQTVTSIPGLDPAISYNFAVTAYDTAGNESGFSNIVTLPEQVPPAVAITAPSDAATVSGVVTVSAAASDNSGVTTVEFSVNGMVAATTTDPPYLFAWDTTGLAPGAYTLVARASDAAGNVSQARSTLTVAGDTEPPAVAVTSPAPGAVVSGTITVTVAAGDKGGVTLVEVYGNGVLLSAGNVAPYGFSWDTTTVADGSYGIIALARDSAGNTAQSAPITVTVSNIPPDTIPPTMLSFTLPATSGFLTVPVTGLGATDDVGVVGYLVSEGATPPLTTDPGWSGSVPQSITFGAAGSRTAYAWARDAAGNVSGSLAATVTIDTGLSDVQYVAGETDSTGSRSYFDEFDRDCDEGEYDGVDDD